tara:strand:- start:1329 stop:1772 length:444 start_codon:yes stop_codon:yes gene_type:complete
MVDPDVRDWERLRKAIPAIEVASIDEQMKVYLDAAAEELNKDMEQTEWHKQHVARAEQAEYEDRWGKEDEAEDVVNNPDHYNTGAIECIDAIESSMSGEGFRSYCKGNVQKYLWRYEMKGKPVEDLQKAQWYLATLLNFVIFEDGEK